MPLEIEYSDDVDFMDTSMENLLSITSRKKDFNEGNLQINELDTDFVDFRIASKEKFKDDGTPLIGSEEWCSVIIHYTPFYSINVLYQGFFIDTSSAMLALKVWRKSGWAERFLYTKN